MTAADLPSRLRAAAALADRHQPTPHRQSVCIDCFDDRPCEAQRMAEALIEAADALDVLNTQVDFLLNLHNESLRP